jgi:serine/threonine protein kinase
MSTLAENTILGGNWKITRFLGEGACAKVYQVTSTNKINDNLGFEIVAKVIPLPGQPGNKVNKKEQERICNTLNYEYTLYTGVLYGFPCCPRNPQRFFGDDSSLKVRYLVMERLDCDLIGLANRGVPSPAQVADIGLQILEGLRWLHNKTFLFVDVKPDNFMLKGNKVYFVDCKHAADRSWNLFILSFFHIHLFFGSFVVVVVVVVVFFESTVGLTERVTDNAMPSQGFNGTPTFSSVSADKGNALSYRDDIEALVNNQHTYLFRTGV